MYMYASKHDTFFSFKALTLFHTQTLNKYQAEHSLPSMSTSKPFSRFSSSFFLFALLVAKRREVSRLCNKRSKILPRKLLKKRRCCKRLEAEGEQKEQEGQEEEEE